MGLCLSEIVSGYTFDVPWQGFGGTMDTWLGAVTRVLEHLLEG